MNMMNIEWQGAQDIKDIYGCLIDTELNVSVEARDQASAVITHAQMQKFAGLGIYTYNLPEAWGGLGWKYAPWGHVLEKIGYLSLDVSFPFLISVRMSFITALLAVQRADINDVYIKDLIEGKKRARLLTQRTQMHFHFYHVQCLKRVLSTTC